VKAYYAGCDDSVAELLQAEIGRPLERGLPVEPAEGDLIFIETSSDDSVAGDLCGGNAFSACRAIKQVPGVYVFLVARATDRFAAEIARFCLADGCVLKGEGGLKGLEAVHKKLAPPRVLAVEKMLAELEAELASDEGRRESGIQKMLGRERQEWVLETLTDDETGLFAGPFASFKLDEEFKRAMRFHQSLSLILLDIGAGSNHLPAKTNERSLFFAEVAAVFLSGCRGIDTLARFTETAFLFLLPGTGIDGAIILARRLQEELAGREFSSGSSVEACIGIATIPASGIERRDQFLARAEACLRLAQQGQGDDGLCASWD